MYPVNPLVESSGESLRSEVEADGNNTEKSKAYELDRYTDFGDCFSTVRFRVCVFGTGADGGYFHCADELEEESNCSVCVMI